MLVIQLVYQQLENYVVYPIVYRKAVSLSPFTTIAAVLISGSLLGVVGAILAVPFAAVIKVVLREATRPRAEDMAAPAAGPEVTPSGDAGPPARERWSSAWKPPSPAASRTTGSCAAISRRACSRWRPRSTGAASPSRPRSSRSRCGSAATSSSSPRAGGGSGQVLSIGWPSADAGEIGWGGETATHALTHPARAR